MIKVFLFLMITFAFSARVFASARVCIIGDKLEVYSNLIFYGDKAKANGPACAKEISRLFNEPSVTLNIRGKKRKVKFKISYQVEDEKAVFSSVNINSRVSNNYIRIEEKANNEKNGRSNHNLAANCGFYSKADDLGSSTTCAHEFAHGLGLIHYDERKSGYGSNKDIRGKGVPGIMAARGFYVDPKYQYNPKAKVGASGGTINPVHRRVRVEDIHDLNLASLEFDEYGCADLGKVSNIAYTKDGKQTKSENSYFTDALDYFSKGLSGGLGEPILCE